MLPKLGSNTFPEVSHWIQSQDINSGSVFGCQILLILISVYLILRSFYSMSVPNHEFEEKYGYEASTIQAIISVFVLVPVVLFAPSIINSLTPDLRYQITSLDTSRTYLSNFDARKDSGVIQCGDKTIFLSGAIKVKELQADEPNPIVTFNCLR